jgi:hypothetical protein
MKKTVFILGHARSGTTLLNKVLSAHPNIHFISGEFSNFPLYYFGKNSYKQCSIIAKDLLRHLKIENAVKYAPPENYREFMDKIFDWYRGKNKKDIIGAKATVYILENVEMIRSIFQDAYCIHLIRDPRDIALSLNKARFGPKSFFYIAKAWKETVDKIRKLKKYVNHYYEIKYEDLITNPEKESRKLCDFLGVPFSKNMLNFYKYVGDVSSIHRLLKKRIIKDNYNKWKRELKENQLRLIYAAAGKRIYELKYTKKEHKAQISFLERLSEYVSDKIKVRLRLLRHTGRFFRRKNKYMKSRIIKKNMFLQ